MIRPQLPLHAAVALVLLGIGTVVAGVAPSALQTGPKVQQAHLRGLAAVFAGEANSGGYGAPLIAGCAWATWVTNCANLTVYGNGSSFNDSGCGTPFGCTFGPEFQCTQLAQRYAYYAWGEPANWYGYGGVGGNAADMWISGPALPIPLEQLGNGMGIPPRRGDIMIFGPGWLGAYWDGAGHVAVVTDTGPGYVDIVEQNATSSGSDRLALNGSLITANGYTPVIGWLRNLGMSLPVELTTATLGGAPQAVSPLPGVTDVFWRGVDNQLETLTETGGSISQPWFNANPANMASDPSVVSAAAGTVSVFWQGTDGYLWTENSATGYRPENLGDGPLGSPPQAVSTGNGAVEVFWRGADGDLWTDSVAGNIRTGARLLGSEPLAGTPHPVAYGAGQIAVFWRGIDANLWFDTNTGSGWSGEQMAGYAPMASDPNAASPYPGRIEVTWVGTDTRVWASSYSGGAWSGRGYISSTGIASAPVMLSPTSGVLTAFFHEFLRQTGDVELCHAGRMARLRGREQWTSRL